MFLLVAIGLQASKVTISLIESTFLTTISDSLKPK